MSLLLHPPRGAARRHTKRMPGSAGLTHGGKRKGPEKEKRRPLQAARRPGRKRLDRDKGAL